MELTIYMKFIYKFLNSLILSVIKNGITYFISFKSYVTLLTTLFLVQLSRSVRKYIIHVPATFTIQGLSSFTNLKNFQSITLFFIYVDSR